VPIVMKQLSEEYIPAVRDFNKRNAAGGMSYRFPESSTPEWLPRKGSIPVYQEHYVALEGSAVRGGYIIKRQTFACNGDVMTMAHYQLPISEGVIDRRYAPIGILMLKDAVIREPLLFALGIGGYQEALTRMLKVMKWSIGSCPFFFKVTHPFRFLREMAFLRRKRMMQVLMDNLAFSGVGWLTIKSLQLSRAWAKTVPGELTTEEVNEFSSWSDDVWGQAKNRYALIAVRDALTLNMLYPSTDPRFHRIKVLRRSKPIGWAVVMNTSMENNKYFGNLRVGSVVDCLAAGEEERHVVRAATRFLERVGVDIVVTNQREHSWCHAFSHNGYLRGPSNFLFAASPLLAKKLHPFEDTILRVHLTRGDGDGPINL
jgi:hypothetical protein